MPRGNGLADGFRTVGPFLNGQNATLAVFVEHWNINPAALPKQSSDCAVARSGDLKVQSRSIPGETFTDAPIRASPRASSVGFMTRPGTLTISPDGKRFPGSSYFISTRWLAGSDVSSFGLNTNVHFDIPFRESPPTRVRYGMLLCHLVIGFLSKTPHDSSLRPPFPRPQRPHPPRRGWSLCAQSTAGAARRTGSAWSTF